jgi:hypothetical protein
MEAQENKEFPEIHSERLYDVFINDVEDGETRWSVAAPNKKSVRLSFHNLLGRNKDSRITVIRHNGAVIISQETVRKLRDVSH